MVDAPTRDEARAFYDFHGYVVVVQGRMIDAFDREYRRFRAEATHRRPDLSVLPGATFGRDLADPAFDVLPDGLEIERGAPVLRYGPKARSGLLLELSEISMHWPDKALIHAASATRDNAGVLIAAPNATGKTSALVELLTRRFGFLADDWSLVDRRGLLYPFPKSIHVYDYNLSEVPALRGRIPGLGPWSHAAWGFYGRTRTKLLARTGERPRFFVKHIAKKRTWHLEAGHFGTHVATRTPMRVAVWLQRDDVQRTVVEEIPASEFARRAVAYLLYDRASQLRMVNRLAAFGAAPWLAHVESLPRRSAAILEAALGRCAPAHIVRVPRRATPGEVARSIATLVEATEPRRAEVSA